MKYAVAASSVAVGDFNGDGFPDLAIVFAGGVRVLLGNGDGTFQSTPVSYVAGSFPSSLSFPGSVTVGDFNSLAVGDFNGDGFPDIAVANFFSNNVSILLNDGKWAPSVALCQLHGGFAQAVGATTMRTSQLVKLCAQAPSSPARHRPGELDAELFFGDAEPGQGRRDEG